MSNVKIFLDFWNFQLSWNFIMSRPGTTQPVRIDWKGLPQTLISELPPIVGTSTPLTYKGSQIYASVNPKKDEKLKKFLHTDLGQMTGYKVMVRDRRRKTVDCPHCSKTIERSVEKGVDASIVTDLFEGAINESYDIARLVSNDSDYVPALQTIQDRLNRQIIHVGFRSGGHHLRTAAWGHMVLDGKIANALKRSSED